jgi:hypothetical protein
MTTWIGCPKTNFYPLRHGFQPEAIVLHSLDDDLAGSESLFLDPASQESVHYTVSLLGDVYQYVDENDTAFHAGVAVNSSWELLKRNVNPNFYTIGVALEGRVADPHPAPQLNACASLILEIAARWGIALDTDHIIGHNKIRASKNCPGGGLEISQLLMQVPDTRTALPRVSATVRTVRNVNVRRERPNTGSAIDRALPAGSDVSVVGFTIGERIEGNPYWYADPQGNYLWAGATDAPSPVPIG